MGFEKLDGFVFDLQRHALVTIYGENNANYTSDSPNNTATLTVTNGTITKNLKYTANGTSQIDINDENGDIRLMWDGQNAPAMTTVSVSVVESTAEESTTLTYRVYDGGFVVETNAAGVVQSSFKRNTSVTGSSSENAIIGTLTPSILTTDGHAVVTPSNEDRKITRYDNTAEGAVAIEINSLTYNSVYTAYGTMLPVDFGSDENNPTVASFESLSVEQELRKILHITGDIQEGVELATGDNEKSSIKVILDESNSGTAVTIGDGGPVIKGTKGIEFRVAGDGSITETGEGGTITIQSGNVTTTDTDGKFTFARTWGPEDGQGKDSLTVSASVETATVEVGLNEGPTLTIHKTDIDSNAPEIDTMISNSGAITGMHPGTVTTDGAINLSVDKAVFALTGAGTVKTTEYNTNGAKSYLTSGVVTAKDCLYYDGTSMVIGVLVSDSGTNPATSVISTESNTATIQVTGGKYTISNLANAEQITIDSKTYTYDSDNKTLLTEGGEGFVLNDDISQDGKVVTFTIKGGTTEATDEIDASTGSVYKNIKTPGVLASEVDSLQDGDKVFFAPDGSLQASETGAGYILEKKDGSVTLTATNLAATGLTIDATGANLYNVDLSASTAALVLKIDSEHGITTGKLANNAASEVKVFETIDGVSTLIANALGTASANQTLENIGKNITLTGGEYASASGVSVATTEYTVKIGNADNQHVTFVKNGETPAIGTYTSANEITIDSGQVTLEKGIGTRKVNGFTYEDAVTPTELTFSGHGATNQAYLTDGTVKGVTTVVNEVVTSIPVLVAKSDGATSNVFVDNISGDAKPEIAVSATGKYTISGLADNDQVQIDSIIYTYSGDVLTPADTTGDPYLVKAAGIVGFNILSTQDTIDSDTAVVYVESLTKSLTTISGKLDENVLFYFAADGSQQANLDDNATAYIFAKTATGFELTSTAKADTTAVPINAVGMTNLTIDLSKGTGANEISIDAGTNMSGKLGAGDSIKSADVENAVAGTAGAQFSVADQGKVTLTEGTYTKADSVAIDTLYDTTSEKYSTVTIGTSTAAITFGDTESHAVGSYSSENGVVIQEGQVTLGSTATKTVNEVTYTDVTTATELTFIGAGSTDQAYLITGTVKGATTGDIPTATAVLVGNAKNSTTSSILLKDDSDEGELQVSVAAGKYTISNLTGGDKVTIDGVEYTVNENATALQVTENSDLVDKYRLISAGTIAFTINGGITAETAADSVDTTTAYEVVGSLNGDGALKNLTDKITGASATLWFGANGEQLSSKAGAAYTLTKATDTSNKVTYTLTSTTVADSDSLATIDASGVAGLTVDLTAHASEKTSPVLKVTGDGTDPVTVTGKTTVLTNTGKLVMADDNTTGNVKITAAGVISNISEDAKFVTTDTNNDVNDGNPMNFKVIKPETEVKGAVFGGYIYKFTSGKILDDVTITMVDSTADTIQNMEVSTGFDFTATQYLDLGSSTATAENVNSSNLPKADSASLQDGHIYLKYDADVATPKLSVVNNDGTAASYGAVITIDASAYEGTTLALDNTQTFSVDLIVGAVTVSGVTKDDTINGVSMAGAETSDLTVVGKVDGTTKSVASISGLANGTSLGTGDGVSKIPEGIIVNTAAEAGTFAVNGQTYVLTTTANVIKTTASNSFLCAGTATLSSATDAVHSFMVGNTEKAATYTIGVDKHAATDDSNPPDDTTVTVTVTDNDGFEISNLADGDVVSIDRAVYTYSSSKSALLDEDNHGYLIDNNDIAFKVSTDGSAYELDTSNNEAAVYVGSLTEEEGLNKITSAITVVGDDGKLNFNADGNQQLSATGAAYTVVKTADNAYTLASTDAATSATVIDASKVTGLTVNFDETSNGVQTIVIDSATTITSGTLGAGDIVKVDASKITKAYSDDATFKTADGEIILTGGDYLETDIRGASIDTSNDTTADIKTVVIKGSGGATWYTFGVAGTAATGSYDNVDGAWIKSGQLLVDKGLDLDMVAAGNQQKVNGVTYTSDGASDLTFIGRTVVDNTDPDNPVPTYEAYLTDSGASVVKAAAADTILVADSTLEKTSAIVLTEAAGGEKTLGIKVSGGAYTVEGVENGDQFKVDNVTYTYTAATGTIEGVDAQQNKTSYIIAAPNTAAANVGFTIDAGVDVPTAALYVGSLSSDLSANISKIAATTTLYFDKNGNQINRDGTEGDIAYTLAVTVDADNKHTCVLTSKTFDSAAAGTVDINLSGLTMTNIDLTAVGDGTSTFNNTEKVYGDEKTTIENGTLGAGDMLADISTDPDPIVAGVTGATFKTNEEHDVVLTSGTYSAISDNTLINTEGAATVTLQTHMADDDTKVFTFQGTAGGEAVYYNSNGQGLTGVKAIADNDDDTEDTVTITAHKAGTTNFSVTDSGSNIGAKAISDGATFSVDKAGNISMTSGTFDVIKDAVLAAPSIGNNVRANAKTETDHGYITVTKGSVEISAAGKISNIDKGTEFTIADKDGSDTVSVVAGDNTLSLNGVSYTGTLTTAEISMLDDGAETEVTGMTPAMGFNLTSSTTQWLDLGTNPKTSHDASELGRITAKGYFTAGHYYLEYDGTTKTISVKQAQDASNFKESAENAYAGAITIDAGDLAKTATETNEVTLALSKDSTNKAVPTVVLTNVSSEYLKVTGVTGADTINHVAMTGATDLEVVGIAGTDPHTVTSIDGLNTGESLTDIPADVTVTTTALDGDGGALGHVTVNGDIYKGYDTFTIYTTSNGTGMVYGHATIDTDATDNLDNTSVRIASITSDGDELSSPITVANIESANVTSASAVVKETAGLVTVIDDLTKGGSLTNVPAGTKVGTAIQAGAFAVNGSYYKGTADARLYVMADTNESYLYSGTVEIDVATDDPAGDNNTSVTVATGLDDETKATLAVTAGSATVTAKDGEFDNATDAIVLTAGTVITGVPASQAVKTAATADTTYSVNGIGFKNDTASAITASVDALTNPTKLTVSGDITTGTDNKTYDVAGTTYSNVSEGVALTSAEATLVTGKQAKVGTHDLLTVGAETSGQIKYSTSGAITGFDTSTTSKDSFTLGGATYTFGSKEVEDSTSPGSTKQVPTLTIKGRTDGKNGVYDISGATVSITDADGTNDAVKIGTYDFSTATDLNPIRLSSPIELDPKTFAPGDPSTIYFNASGDRTEDVTEAVAAVTKKSDGSYELKMTGKLDAEEVTIDGVAVNITDGGTDTKYATGTGTFTAKGTASVDAAGSVADTGTDGIAVVSGNVKLSDADAKVSLAGSADDSTVTFTLNTKPAGAEITIDSSNKITVTETGDGTDTTIKKDGTVTGLDGNATLTGVPAGVPISTTGAGTVSLNGLSFTTDDANGIDVSQNSVDAKQLDITLDSGSKVAAGTEGMSIGVTGTTNVLTGLSSGAVVNSDGSLTLGAGKSGGVGNSGTITNTGTTEFKVDQNSDISTTGGSLSATGVPSTSSVTTNGSGTVSINGLTFTVDGANGVTAKQNSGNAKQLDITTLAAGNKVSTVTEDMSVSISGNTYTGLSSGAVINPAGTLTLGAGKYGKVGTSGTITNEGSTDFTVDSNGDITTEGGDLSVKGAYANNKIKTNGDGTATINGMSYTVSDSGTGVTFTAAGKGVSSFSGLANGATLKLEGEFSGISITDDDLTATISNVTSSDGIELKKVPNGASSSYQLTLDKAGEKFTFGTSTIKAETTSDGIVFDGTNNSITGLSNGDKVSITRSTGTVTYEVKDGILTITDEDGNTATFKQADSTVPMSVQSIKKISDLTATSVSGNSTDASEQAATGGLEVGGSKVDSVTNGMMVDNNGKATTDESKATAKITISDNGEEIKYETTNNRAQNIEVKTGTAAANMEWDITTGDGANTIDLNSTKSSSITTGNGRNDITLGSSGDTTVKTGMGNDTINSSATGDTIIETAGGRNTINLTNATGSSTVSSGSGNDTVNASGNGEYVISSTGGNNKLSHTGTGDATISGGSGNDTIKAAGLNDVVSGGDGNNTFDVSSTSAAISDYTYGKDTLVTSTTTGKQAIAPSSFSTEGKITTASGQTVDLSNGTGTDGFYAATLADSDGGNKQAVAWATDDGSNINISGVSESVVLIGNQNSDTGDTLSGGSGDDTIYAGANDSVYGGGAGHNKIVLDSTATGAVVGMGTSGNDTVTGFTNGFDRSEADTLYLLEMSGDMSFKLNGNNLYVNNGNGKMELDNLKTNSGVAEILVNDAKVAAASSGNTINANSNDYAEYYFGTKNGSVGSGLSFQGTDDSVNIDLRDTDHFRNISSITGGTGDNTLIGGTGKETLKAASDSNSSIWGGAGNDVMISSTDSKTEFFFMSGDGSDTISGFTAGTSDTSDVLNLFNTAGVRMTNSGLKVTTTTGDSLMVSGNGFNANSEIKWSDGNSSGVAKVGRTDQANKFSVADGVTNYIGSGKGDTVSITDNEGRNVWLDGSQGASYSGISVIQDTSNGDNQLAGGTGKETLIGGTGNDSLWGGSGNADDVLIGNGQTDFFYNVGGGNDSISGHKGDSLDLFDMQLSDITGAVIDTANKRVIITTATGDKVTVSGGVDSFKVGGQTWTTSYSGSNDWTLKQ